MCRDSILREATAATHRLSLGGIDSAAKLSIWGTILMVRRIGMAPSGQYLCVGPHLNIHRRCYMYKQILVDHYDDGLHQPSAN